MRSEVHSAADFVMNLLRVKQANPLPETQLQHFKGSLEDVLLRKYRAHWYPEVPTKGSGFRCIRINGKMDPIIEKAGVAVGLNAIVLRKMLPQELTMWIDPAEVSYRIGENGSICVLLDQASRASPSSDLDSSGSSDEFVMERVGRLDLSSDTSSVMVDFYESQSALVLTQSKHKFNNHHYSSSKRHNNSMSSTSSGQMSPPLSPQYTSNNKYQQNQVNHHNNHYYSSSQHQQHQQYFHWDNNQYVNNKVRTQC